MAEKHYRAMYRTPEGLDDIIMESDGSYLTALSFADQEEVMSDADPEELPVFFETRAWLDAYFAKDPPETLPPLKPDSSTPFRALISKLMLEIPWGESVTYGDLAKKAAGILKKEKMSAQAVGQAVGHNPICILIPCHRVLGRNGSLTGYGGGLENKKYLLHHEGIPCTP